MCACIGTELVVVQSTRVWIARGVAASTKGAGVFVTLMGATAALGRASGNGGAYIGEREQGGRMNRSLDEQGRAGRTKEGVKVGVLCCERLDVSKMLE